MPAVIAKGQPPLETRPSAHSPPMIGRVTTDHPIPCKAEWRDYAR